MEGYDAATYGQRCADVYDAWYDSYDKAALSLLADLANDGRTLELGIGTGRIALPLAALGVEVHGIDASEAMIDRLRAKPGGAAIPVMKGDFADVAVEGRFSLIFVVINTLFCLTTQEDQVRCFRNAAQHLTAEGVFVIEAFVPDTARFSQGGTARASRVEADHVVFEAARHDPVSQRVMSQQVSVTERGTRLFPLQIRYAWPSELDLMAQLAGLRLRERWGGWQREPFVAASGKHVSVYERAAGE